MRVIGGLASWDPAQIVTPALVQAMIERVSGRRARSWTGLSHFGIFSTLDAADVTWSDDISFVADLELTNLGELRPFAGNGAHRSELIGALYALEGPEFVRRLRGGFAFGLWDRRLRTLVLAVDQLGIKRLYYATGPGATAFASQPRAVRSVPGVEGRIDVRAVHNYLNFGYVPAPASIFSGIRRLAPGELLVIRDGKSTLQAYWNMAYPEQSVAERESAATLYRLTAEAVGRALPQKMSKNVGAFLSGGTDSSVVVGLMSQLTDERVNAFSIGFREGRYNELDYATIAARRFAASHYTKTVSPAEAFALLPRLVEIYDEPFGNNSAIGAFFCAQLARESGVTTLLAGDGGDEIFGGNERYTTDQIFARYHRIPAPVRQRLLEPLVLNLPDGGGSVVGRAQHYIRRANLPNPRRFYSYEFFFAQDGAGLLTPEFRDAVTDAPYAVLDGHYARAQATSDLNRLLYLDIKLTIGDNDLLKVTRTAELAGLDVRFPLLDLALVEFTGTLPARFKVRGLEKRYLFRRAFGNLLPQEILAKRKHGFGVPTSSWLKDDRAFRELAHDTLLSARARQRGYFASDAFDRLFQFHAADTTPYYGDVLWRVLMLELWHRRHADGTAAS